MQKSIKVVGARTHNLKNITVEIPRNKLTIITGLSGSGKSSLAFDTIYAEGQRRYIESLNSYARQFLGQMDKPDVDNIEGLSPAIAIEQKSTSHNPRSTVGTVTEIYDYLRLLFARVGNPVCPNHNIELNALSISQMVDKVVELPQDENYYLLAPLIIDRKGEHKHIFEDLIAKGFVRVRIDKRIYELEDLPQLDKDKKHTIEVIVDRFKLTTEITQRLADSLQTALTLSDGLAIIAPFKKENTQKEEVLLSNKFSCVHCGWTIAELEPKLFSFNNPFGACEECDGIGKQQYVEPALVVDENLSIKEGAIAGWTSKNAFYYAKLEALAKHFKFSLDKPFNSLSKKVKEVILYGTEEEVRFTYQNDEGDIKTGNSAFEGVLKNIERRIKDNSNNSRYSHINLSRFVSEKHCKACNGGRLNKQALSVLVDNQNLNAITNLSVKNALAYYQNLKLQGNKQEIAEKILKEIIERLSFLENVGLDYLTLNRSAATLSGGESQRIRLASQIGAGLVGVMYVLDEPSIGLHQRDNEKLLQTLKRLRDLGNTVIVVEHDEDAIRDADFVLDIGPKAGVYGGEVIAYGSPSEIMQNQNSLTGQYLSGEKQIIVPTKRREIKPYYFLEIIGASGNNLKNVNVKIPLGVLTCITGVSGSGKSTLINSTLYPLAATAKNGATTLQASPYEKIEGLHLIDKVIDINQSAIGRTPRSNPATYTGIFTTVRELFAATNEAKMRGYQVGRFSFNVKGGRCEHCDGDGLIKVEMHFLPDVYVKCEHCQGQRYNRETLEILYKGKNIFEVLQMTVTEAREFFDAIPAIAIKLQTLMDVGLSYITLGQSATTFSGGEAQRIKLATELARKDTGGTLYILDEPTTGLHFEDVNQLLGVINRLTDAGNTVVIIEHNLDVIKTADYIIDLGPEGGNAGGQIIAEGRPEDVVQNKQSYTGKFLKPLLEKAKVEKAKVEKVKTKRKTNAQNK